MKKIYKLLMSVVAVAGTLACTTDATEDLGVKVGGKTQLTLSLDNSRTQLGEKADGVYPLTWSEGDQISVNGVASEPLATEDGAGTANAIFTFGGTLQTPYFVAYPATEVANQVKFAAEQYYNNNTSFESGVAAMYGRSEDGKSVKLNHLTGILKIGIKGEAKLLQARISTVDRKPIAGTFNAEYDTEKGEYAFTPAETSEVITYYFGMYDEALDLSMQDGTTYIYVAVPTINGGVYNELYVTLTDNENGVMYTTIKADTDKPLKAGAVREFSSDITYAAISESDAFVIDSYAALDRFKLAVEAGSNLDAVVVADIDVEIASATEGVWKSINAPNYDGTIYGNGYSIKNLNAPLFNQTSASFKGLHLDVVVEEKVNPNFGAFARKLIANGKQPKIEHCSVSGAIKINTDVAPSTADVLGDGAVGGFVGSASYVQFDNCVNNASITVSQMSSSTNMHATIGGLMGYTYADGSEYTQFKDCANRGKITVNDTTGKLNLRVGGFIGCQRETKSTILFDHCQSEGAISIGENASYRLAYIAGFVADGYTSSDTNTTTFNFKNETLVSSDLIVKGSASSYVRVGSFVGYQYYSTININGETVINGAIDVNVTASNASQIGGLVGYMNSGAIINIHNNVERTENATINIEGSYQNNCYVGGLTGQTEKTSSYINIHKKTFSNSGHITLGKVTTNSNTAVGGVVGWMNYGNILFGNGKIINSGTITVTKDATTNTNKSLFVGGFVGAMINNSAKFGTISDTEGKGEAVNTGDIIFEGTANGKLNIGGFLGVYNSTSSLGDSIPKINTGNIKATGVFQSLASYNKDNYVGVGGFTGYHNTETSGDSRAYKNVQCYCEIEAYTVTKNGDEYQFTPYPRVGLLTGSQLPNTSTSSSNISVGGKIATTATVVNGEVVPDWADITKTNYTDYIFGVDGLTGFSTVNWLESENEIQWVIW